MYSMLFLPVHEWLLYVKVVCDRLEVLGTVLGSERELERAFILFGV